MSGKLSRQRGAALIIVLWTALLLSVVLAIASARIEARIAAAEKEAFLARQAAIDGLEFAAQSIASELGGRIDDIATLEFSINGYDVSFAPSEESEKLDINLASEETLANFFLFLGAEQEPAVQLAARVADWRDADDLARPNGAERREYASAKNGEQIGNRLFYSADEVTNVLDMPEQIATCALPALTIFGDSDAPSSKLLTKLYGRDMERQETITGVQLGTASRSAAAGRRYAIVATAKKSAIDTRPVSVLTGVFRITGGQPIPYEWIVQFPSINAIDVNEECNQPTN